MYCSILLPVDLDQPRSWKKALPTAVALSRCFDAKLSLASVVPEHVAMVKAQWSAIGYREMIETARARLGSLAATIEGAGNIDYHVDCGAIHATILSIAERFEADLIVLSSHRPVMRDYLLGANALRVLRHAKCSVFVVRDAEIDAD
ncbi:universal stress protein [Sphingomonas sp. BGYR3]|uniref:universal stress protein n=1 Tax=Sphingomonas sp. BGYR3 TaxID=2975483 RepID=UPI0021A36CB6|nr:universal stress protein [Sphingomonas sp. BGYR3]MDG5488820.1 universal stress protein [Sphingomonas sp. BGYR3]